MEPIGFAKKSKDDFATVATTMRFAGEVARSMGIDPPPPTDDNIRTALRAANRGLSKAGETRRIPVDDASIAAVRAYL